MIYRRTVNVPVPLPHFGELERRLCHGVVLEHGCTLHIERMAALPKGPYFPVLFPEDWDEARIDQVVTSISTECERVLRKQQELVARASIEGFREAEAELNSAAQEVIGVLEGLKKVEEGAQTLSSLAELATRAGSALIRAKKAVVLLYTWWGGGL